MWEAPYAREWTCHLLIMPSCAPIPRAGVYDEIFTAAPIPSPSLSCPDNNIHHPSLRRHIRPLTLKRLLLRFLRVQLRSHRHKPTHPSISKPKEKTENEREDTHFAASKPAKVLMAWRSTCSCSQRSAVCPMARDMRPRLPASWVYSRSLACVAFVGALIGGCREAWTDCCK